LLFKFGFYTVSVFLCFAADCDKPWEMSSIVEELKKLSDPVPSIDPEDELHEGKIA